LKRYNGREIEVTYDPVRCLHAAECVRGLPAVFDTSRRPWVQPDGAEAEVLAAVIERCPTGALHYTRSSGLSEKPTVPTRIEFPKDGPMLVTGDLEIDGKRETRAALCRCGKSSNQPYCDRSGTCRDWRYEAGSVESEGDSR
jgi:uncharacterized Fe-S cluster protein YjdI/CDGSH-type Zn-finger protein